MKAEISVFAPAKINLTLHVTGRRDDGYHLLDSLVVFTAIGDTVTVTPAHDLTLRIDGPEASGLSADPDNLVLRAARFLNPDKGAHIRLTKRLPVASGIGGGSADAAATIRALCQLWGRPLPTPAATAPLGADVPVCLAGQPCRMEGTGDQLSAIPALPPLDCLLVNPRVSVPTGAVFQRLAQADNRPMPDVPATDIVAWLGQQRNDLMAPAVAVAPEIADVLQSLRALTPLHCAMSGSGATCFALFPRGTLAAEGQAQIQRTHPTWWSAQARVL